MHTTSYMQASKQGYVHLFSFSGFFVLLLSSLVPATAVAWGLDTAKPPLPTIAVPLGADPATPPIPAIAVAWGPAWAMLGSACLSDGGGFKVLLATSFSLKSSPPLPSRLPDGASKAASTITASFSESSLNWYNPGSASGVNLN